MKKINQYALFLLIIFAFGNDGDDGDVTHPVEEAVKVNMNTISWSWVKQYVLAVSISQPQNISHHTHHSYCPSVGKSGVVPGGRVWEGS